MRKNSSLMYAILGGVITCFVCVGMIFLYPSKETSNLKGNNSSLPSYGEEINLGDPTATPTPTPTATATTTGGWTCIHGHHNVDGDNYCTTCGVSRSATATPKPTATATTTGGWTCIHGHHNVDGDNYCTTCGVSRSATATPKPCSSYTTLSSCVNANCYWYNNTCSSNPTPTPTATSTSTPTPTPTPKPTATSCGSISGCTNMNTSTCKCTQCLVGLEVSSDGKSCIRKPYSTCVSECTAAGGVIGDCEDRCSSAGVSPTPTPKPSTTPTPVPCANYTTSSTCANANCYWNNNTCSNPTPTPEPHYCYKFENNSCTRVTMETCDPSNNLYTSWETCRNNIQCGTNQYIYGNSCLTCPANTQLAKKGCQGNSDSCCVSTSGACFCNPINSRCEWRSTNANNWVEVPSVTTAEQCNLYSSNNSSACFKVGTEYKWIKGSGSIPSGATMVTGIVTKESCDALNAGDPEGGVYGLSCPGNIVMFGQTIACTYSSTTSATLRSASVSGEGAASVSVSGKYVNVTAGNKEGNISVYGTTSDGHKTNSVPLIVSKGAQPSKCIVSISTGSVATSVAENGEDINSYYTVNVVVSGTDCGGQTVTYSCSNCKNNPPAAAYTILAGKTSYSTSFNVYPQKACSKSTTTATLTNGSTDSVTISTNGIRTDWKSSDGHCETSPAYTSFEAADRAGANVYYTNYGKCTNGGTGYRTKWVRGGCGGGTPEKVPYCYIDDDGDYHWTSSPGSSWKKVDGITKEADCKKEEEEPACYKDKDGKYVWGKYAKSDGYTLITSIKDEASCKEPTEEQACYKNSNGDYQWTATPPEGYTKVDDIKTPAECAPPEEPACYLHGSEFVWGKYEKVTGYIKLEDVDSEDKCKAPETDACYEGPDGNYVWGRYGDDPNYTLVPSVTELSQCTKDVPVEPTASDVSKVVYVFMAVLMACGIGFIYYSSVVKKSNQ